MDSQQDLVGIGQLSRAFASTRLVLAGVRPEQLDAATPCASWDVRALIGHFVGSARWGAAAVTGADQAGADQAGADQAGADLEGATEDRAAGDLLAAYDQSIEAALAAFGAAGVRERTIRLPFGTFSGAELAGMVARDQFTHGWDLARAVGQPTGLDPELAGELLVRARVEILDVYRGPEGVAVFGPVVEAPAGAGPADRLAAFLGRSV